MPAVPALDYLADSQSREIPPFCALFGDETFLKRLAIEAITAKVAGQDDDLSSTVLSGGAAELRDVLDLVATASLFGGRRLVIVEQADEFVTKNRAALENFAARKSAAGVLLLEARTWPGNTRLAKAVAEHGLAVDASTPAEGAIVKWLIDRATRCHGSKIDRAAAERVLEIIGPELGRLDQELAKLAAAASGEKIGEELVEKLVAGWRTQTAWEMLDAALSGHTREALVQLEQLLWAGENAIGILAQISATLRRYAAATRRIEHAEATGTRINLRAALEAAGVRTAPFIMNKSESQLRHLGRRRGSQLYAWLLEADLALKGQSSSPKRARIVLERLISRLAIPASSREARRG